MRSAASAWFVAALVVIFAAAVPAQTSLPRLEAVSRQGDFNWVVETAADGSRRGGWVNVQVPLEQVDRSALKPLAPLAAPSQARVEPVSVAAPRVSSNPSGGRPTIFITPTDDNFEVYLSAAMMKKGVPVTIRTKPDGADLVLQASEVEIQKQSTGSKVARCLFAYCAGMEDRGVTSVQLLKGDTVAWSYSVNKGRGQKNRQSLAEAIAKHLKSDYFDQ